MIWVLIGALLIGLSLGVMGSGGSILTVPVLTYLVGQDEKVAIAGSLAIVGTISLVGSARYALKGLVDFRSVLYFGLPGMGGAYLGATLSQYVSGAVQLAVFAALMLAAGVIMLRTRTVQGAPEPTDRAAGKIALEGLTVGVVTGFVGVGGGFLIVPALVLLGGLPMHRAIGTSLCIITLNSFSGLWKYVDVLESLGLHLDWTFIATFAGIGIVGSFAGNALSARLPQDVLRKSFALFLFVIASYVIFQTGSELLLGAAATATPN